MGHQPLTRGWQVAFKKRLTTPFWIQQNPTNKVGFDPGRHSNFVLAILLISQVAGCCVISGEDLIFMTNAFLSLYNVHKASLAMYTFASVRQVWKFHGSVSTVGMGLMDWLDVPGVLREEIPSSLSSNISSLRWQTTIKTSIFHSLHNTHTWYSHAIPEIKTKHNRNWDITLLNFISPFWSIDLWFTAYWLSVSMMICFVELGRPCVGIVVRRHSDWCSVFYLWRSEWFRFYRRKVSSVELTGYSTVSVWKKCNHAHFSFFFLVKGFFLKKNTVTRFQRLNETFQTFSRAVQD